MPSDIDKNDSKEKLLQQQLAMRLLEIEIINASNLLMDQMANQNNIKVSDALEHLYEALNCCEELYKTRHFMPNNSILFIIAATKNYIQQIMSEETPIKNKEAMSCGCYQRAVFAISICSQAINHISPNSRLAKELSSLNANAGGDKIKNAQTITKEALIQLLNLVDSSMQTYLIKAKDSLWTDSQRVESANLTRTKIMRTRDLINGNGSLDIQKTFNDFTSFLRAESNSTQRQVKTSFFQFNSRLASEYKRHVGSCEKYTNSQQSTTPTASLK